MSKLTDKYYKIFKLEGEQGYENRAVTGGIQRLAEIWPSDAREAGLQESLIPAITAILHHYPNLDTANRRAALLEVGDLLSIPNIQTLAPIREKAPAADSPEVKETAARPDGRSSTQPTAPRPTASEKNSVVRAPYEEQVVRSKVNTRMKEIARRPMADEQAGLDAPITVIRGVGEKQAQHLARMGVNTLKDMLYLFPRRYDDYSRLKTINQLRYGEEVTVIAKVLDFNRYPSRQGRSIVEAVVSDTTGSLRLLWFNQDFQMRYLRRGQFISISGKVDTYLGRPVIYFPEYEPIDQEQLNTNRIVPVYPLTAMITQRWLRRTQFNIVNYWAARVPEFMPESILNQADLVSLNEALRQIHFPESQEALAAARRRFAFDEIFLQQLGIIRQKRQWQQLTGTPFAVEDAWLEKRLQSLPYQLTHAQQEAVAHIRQDLAQDHPMNRLLQGDVGSGKTVVAVLGMSIVIQNGAQAALMAPTGILADQHFQTVRRLLTQENNGIEPLLEPGQVRLLTGDTNATDRQEILAGLASGYIKLIIGTHSLIEEPVVFQNLQMAVVDEQHRFGVAQRAALRSKGSNPHLLVMTATPIPRSLQLTVFGDLDVSVMDEMPAGRLPIETYIVLPAERERVYGMVSKQVAKGFQAFIIYPLVEQGDKEEGKAAVEEQQRLQREVFPNLRIGLVHGRMKPAEKDAVMLAFRNKEYDVLVSTSVVEVGVDIPNATLMVIEGADRFGLAQLHQFRGRVGRGSAQSYCILIPESDAILENERLQVMTETTDGFVLAEHDLRLRGPGDFLGTRQAGFADFKMALQSDVRTIEKARTLAQDVFTQDADLEKPEHAGLKQAVNIFWPAENGNGDMS